jgi:heat shock protein HslJ
MSPIRSCAAAAVLLASVALSGCAGSSGGSSIDPGGSWGDTSDTAEPSLTLADDGSLTGTDGCNRLSGSWRLEDDDLVYFDAVASTRMACEDVDTWLEGLSQATISGSTMTITGADGAEIGTLERTSSGEE